MTSMSARGRIAALFDSFHEFEEFSGVQDPIRFPGYNDALAKARSSSGEMEAVVTGSATIGDETAVVAVFEFDFMGGSMGRAVGDLLERAMQRASELAVPFLCVTSTGGARMQEGMAALAQMPRTVAASYELSRGGIPRITVLGNPTTGGVYASFASLADVVIAEEDATIGFAGPRIVETMDGVPLPSGSHSAMAALEAGLIDAVLPAMELKPALSRLLKVLGRDKPSDRRPPDLPSNSPPAVARPADSWAEVELARHSNRPAPNFYISRLFDPRFELHGDRAGSDDPAVASGFARFNGRRVAYVALDKGRPTAGGFRKATRAVQVAGRLGMPIVTLVDTPGADPGFESEYSGLANAIAKMFEALLSAPVPTVSVVTGEGGSGGALALACTDVVGIQQHAVFSVIAPEGAAEILYRDSGRAAEVAEDLRPTSSDLKELGLADEIIPEPGNGAHSDAEGAAKILAEWLSRAIVYASGNPATRVARYRGK